MASTRIYRTCGTPTNDKIFTLSAWIRFNSATGHVFFGSDASNNTSWTQVRFSSDSLELSSYSTNWVRTTRKFRDFSAWYHIVITCDSTQATAADRIKWWVNGEQITDFSVDNRSSTSLNQSWGWNKNTTVNNIGGENASGYGDFSIAHFHNIDGTAYQASDFGETDATTGQWKPKSSPSVSYGNNGYFLKFGSSGSLGTDSSGNNNTNTIGGTLTQTQDTPANVFCTMNGIAMGYNGTLANRNTTVSTNASNYMYLASTLGVSTGKWYWEAKLTTAQSWTLLGITDQPNSIAGNSSILGSGAYDYSIYYGSDGSTGSGGGHLFNNAGTGPSNTPGGFMGAISQGDIFTFALDLDNNNFYVGTNGNWANGSGSTNQTFANSTPKAITAASSTNTGFYFPAIGDYGGSAVSVVDMNFGDGYFGTTAVSSANSDGAGYGLFEYAPPTGYYSLCTKNINTYG